MKVPVIAGSFGFMFGIALIGGCLWLFPGAFPSTTFVGAALTAFIAGMAYGRCPWATKAGWAILAVAWVATMAGNVINTSYFVSLPGSSLSDPVLANHDQMREWVWAKYLVAGGTPPLEFPFRGFSRIIAVLLYLFGCNIQVPMIFCGLCYLLAIVVTGSITWQLSGNRTSATVAMLMTTLMCYLFAQSTLLIKDAPVTLLMAVIVFYLVRLRKTGRLSVPDYAGLVAVLVVSLYVRPMMLYFVVVCALIFIDLKSWRSALPYLALAVFCVALKYIGIVYIGENVNVVKVAASDSNAELILCHPQTMAWDEMTGDYTSLPYYKKLLWLPASVIVQFLIPFPWNFERDMIFGPVEAVAHFGYFYYLAMALVAYWLVKGFRKSPVVHQRLLLCGIVLYVFTAYVTSGRISRYCMLELPMFLPFAAIAAVTYFRSRSLYVWLGVFVAMLVPTLLICYHLQSAWL